MLWSETNFYWAFSSPFYTFRQLPTFRKHFRKYFRKHFRHPESVPHYSVPTTLNKNASWWLSTSGSTPGSTSGSTSGSVPHYSVPTTLNKNVFWWLPTSGSTSGTPKATLTSKNSWVKLTNSRASGLSIILKLYSESTGAIEFIANS